MGAACTACGNKNSYEGIYKDFWSGVKIRAMPQADWCTIVKNKNDPKVKKINAVKWENIIKDNLYWEENRELSSSVFRKAMELSEGSGSQHFLNLSLLFLCPKNSLNTKQHFQDLARVVYGMKDEFKEENHVLYTKKKLLYEVVAFYVNLISLFCVDKLSVLASNSKDFEEANICIFSKEVQELFLNEEIFSGANEEWVNFDGFFEVQYPTLTDDVKVRERLAYFYEVKQQGKTKKTEVPKNN